MRLWTRYGFFDIVRDKDGKSDALTIGTYRRKFLRNLQEELGLVGDIEHISESEYPYIIRTFNTLCVDILKKIVDQL